MLNRGKSSTFFRCKGNHLEDAHTCPFCRLICGAILHLYSAIIRSPSLVLSESVFSSVHCNENTIYVLLSWGLCGFSPNFHIHVSVGDFYIPWSGPHIFLQQHRQTNPWKCINLSQINEYRIWETEHYNSVLEIKVSFLGRHKWESDIYIGFLHGPSFAV
jgi:hypothetical protein